VATAGLGSGLTDYRNPTITEIMRALGYVQRFGAGMAEPTVVTFFNKGGVGKTSRFLADVARCR